MNKSKRYIIVAPPVAANNGVRVLYLLYTVLRQRGYEAFIYCPEEYLPQYAYLHTIDAHTRKNDIVVYPETVSGNPLQFQNVVRYLLYFPGVFEGSTETLHPSEVIFTWDKKYYDAPCLVMPCLDTSLFYDDGTEKTEHCYFVHKGGKWRIVAEIEHYTEINMAYPDTREKLAELLRKTRVLYSFDKNSLINLEAKLCGATVKIVTEKGFADCTDEDVYSNDTYMEQLEYFIRKTQDMQHAGAIEPYALPLSQKRKLCLRRAFVCLISLVPESLLPAKIQRIKKQSIFMLQRAKHFAEYNAYMKNT